VAKSKPSKGVGKKEASPKVVAGKSPAKAVATANRVKPQSGGLTVQPKDRGGLTPMKGSNAPLHAKGGLNSRRGHRGMFVPNEEAPPKPIKCPLNKRELAFFREQLLAKRATLMGDVSKMADEALRKSRQSSTGDLSNMPIHMADLGSDNFEQEFTLGLIENEHVILREIEEALARIENGTYGICLATGKPISKARLKAKPWAKYCIEYAQRLERGY